MEKMSSDYEDSGEENIGIAFTGSIDKCAACLLQDMTGSQVTIDHYRKLITLPTSYIEQKEWFALKVNSISAAQFIESIKIALQGCAR
jgi:hypothetical protein